jgi:hypothetical protein
MEGRGKIKNMLAETDLKNVPTKRKDYRLNRGKQVEVDLVPVIGCVSVLCMCEHVRR